MDWLIRGRELPALADQAEGSLTGDAWPRLAVVIPARNEAASIETALRSVAAQDYPNLKVIVVDDRSTDETPYILHRLSQELPNLRVHTIEKLPPRWLGKTHALWCGSRWAENSQWLLFTDADVIYAPGTLRRAVRYAEAEHLDMLTLYPGLILKGFWERAMIAYFGLLSFFAYAPWRVNHPRSGAYFATGAFNLVRRTSYEKAGTHRALALEVVDDMRLCWLMKRAGAAVRVLIGRGAIKIRWQDGISGIVQGLTKNFFAALDYHMVNVLFAVFAVLLLSVPPFVGIFLLPRSMGWVSLLTLLAVFTTYWLSSKGTGIHFLVAIAHPVCGLVMAGIACRSTFRTLYDRGVTWRGTFYPMELLRNRTGAETSPSHQEGPL